MAGEEPAGLYVMGNALFSAPTMQNMLAAGDPRAQRPTPLRPLDTSMYAVPSGDQSANPANWGRRQDGSAKGSGFLGLLKRPDGKVSSEISIGVPINGKETEIPTIVPTLSQDELDYLINNPIGHGAPPLPSSIIRKAVQHAQARIAAGLSPFKQEGE